MSRRGRKLICLVLTLMMFASSGCSLKYGPLTAEEFRRETLRLEERARNHEDPQVRVESRLELAFLYLHYRNPLLNYGKALQEFEAYLSGREADRGSLLVGGFL